MPKKIIMKQIPALKNGVQRQKRPVRLDLIRPDGMVITLNSTGTVIGECINGASSIADILKVLESKYVMSRDTLRKDLIALVQRLEELEYIQLL